MPRNILEHADELIHGERVEMYGKPEDTFEKIAEVASGIAGHTLSTKDVIFVMVAQKLIRYQTSPENPDHLTDACGYLGILGDLEGYDDRS